MNIDDSQKKFEELSTIWISDKKTMETEQDVRFQVINRMLTEVLGWPHTNIKTESHTESGYIDYLLSYKERNRLVIEAKRAQKILINTVNSRVSNYLIGGAALKSASDGIKQARNYCADTGVQFAGLTSGFEWIGFLAVRPDGKPPNIGKAIVFPDLNALKDNFALFYDLFSLEGILDHRYKVRINEAEGLQISQIEVLNSAVELSQIVLRSKSALAADLERVYRGFFSSMSGDNDPEMLAKCFVESKESREADLSLQKITQNLLNRIEVLSSGQATELQTQIRDAIETNRGEFVLIIGNKGAGKSTFIDRFFRLILDKPLRDRCVILRIDLADSNGDATKIVSWLTDKLRVTLEQELFQGSTPSYEELQGVFIKEYDRWRHGERKYLYENDKGNFKIQFGEWMAELATNKPDKYVPALLNHAVTARKLMPCLVFDNTDHFPQEFQESVFQFGQAIFRTTFSFIICPITDRTIWQLSKSGPLQSYETNALYLPVPSTKDVISKRINFIREKTTDEKDNARSYFLSKGIRLKVDDISAFARCIEDLLVNEDYIARMIGWLSNHDIRRSLHIAQRIIISPVIKIDDLVKLYLSGRHRPISKIRVEQALIQGDYTFFNIQQSDYILNLFAINPDTITTPLLKLSILQLLRDKEFAVNDPTRSYISVNDIFNYFEATSVQLTTIKKHLIDLLQFRLIEPYNPTDMDIYEEQQVRITHSGQIHWEFVFGRDHLTYMTSMSVVTPIRDNGVVSHIQQMMKTHLDINSWKEIAATFVEYLLQQDETFMTLPTVSTYDSQRRFRKELSTRWKHGFYRRA
ncbi:MAG: AAA family ATPase [Acidobacteria bacterium]|nr:AAA family ATPase [Acidobacteriota bacterium]